MKILILLLIILATTGCMALREVSVSHNGQLIYHDIESREIGLLLGENTLDIRVEDETSTVTVKVTRTKNSVTNTLKTTFWIAVGWIWKGLPVFP